MLKIPYTPIPYPDETIGSLLTRFIIYNGRSVWNKIARDFDIKNPSSAQYARADQRIIDFIAAEAGFTPEQAAMQLTTLAYHQAFNAARKRPFDLQPSKIAKEANLLRSIGFIPSRRQAGVQFCPECLSTDMKQFGEPYARRTHQLPTSLLCGIHGRPLFTSCPHCQITVAPFSSMVLRPPTLRCECGKNLAELEESYSSKCNELFMKLTDFGNQMLSLKDTHWNRGQLNQLLVKFTGFSQHHISKIFRNHINSLYGEITLQSEGRFHISPKNSDSALELHGYLSGFRGEEYAVFFSSLGLTPEDIDIGIKNTEDHQIKSRITFSDNDPRALAADTDYAEKAFRHFTAQHPNDHPSRFHVIDGDSIGFSA